MEFTIEEMPVESLRHQSLFQKIWFFLKGVLKDIKSIKPISWFIQRFRRVVKCVFGVRKPTFSLLNRWKKLSAKQELGIVLVILLIAFIGMVGKDLWQASRHSNRNSVLQKELLQNTQKLSILRQEITPLVMFLQQKWLKENAGNMHHLLLLLPELGKYLNEKKGEVTFTAFRKEVGNPHFYIEGTSAQYESVFRLEAFFKENGWQPTLTLDTDSIPTLDLKSFQLKLVPIVSTSSLIATKS